MLIFVLLPIVSLLLISNFFFPEADAVISTRSAWPHSPALSSVTHGNKRREAGDHSPHTHILPSPWLWQSRAHKGRSPNWLQCQLEAQASWLVLNLRASGSPCCSCWEQHGLSYLLQLLVFLQGSRAKSDLAHTVKNAFTTVHSLLVQP